MAELFTPSPRATGQALMPHHSLPRFATPDATHRTGPIQVLRPSRTPTQLSLFERPYGAR